jgi:hypothetical protein
MSQETWEVFQGLYDMINTNWMLFFKRKLLLIKMEENENISKLNDIGEKLSNIDLVAITLNGMLDEYQIFITNIATKEKDSSFDYLTGIILEEKERRKNLNSRFWSSDLVLMAKAKNPYKGKP